MRIVALKNKRAGQLSDRYQEMKRKKKKFEEIGNKRKKSRNDRLH